MKARPILFSGEMVRALLEDRKTQTRRIVKPSVTEAINFMGGDADGAPAISDTVCIDFGLHNDDDGKVQGPEWLISNADYPEEGVIPIGQCPYGQPGDLIWVRESAFPHYGSGEWLYKADLAELRALHARLGFDDPAEFKWLPSIHMPKDASRLTLRISSVRVERLQEISQKDAIAEGVSMTEYGCHKHHYPAPCLTAVDGYRELWDEINGAGAWAANPWVWCVEFEVIRKNVLEVMNG